MTFLNMRQHGAPLRIAQVAPLVEAVPPKAYGGTERVVSWLTEELVAAGHDVTLFAAADSVTSARLEPCAPAGLRLSGVTDHTASHLVMLDRVMRMAHMFDIIHFHIDLLQFPHARAFGGRCLTTLHGRLDLPDSRPVYEHFSDMPLVSISNSQRKGMPASSNWLATIPHGLPQNAYAFSPERGAYLAFLGRISPEKGVDRAIAIAKGVGMPLKIAAKVDSADKRYFEESIKPLLGDPLVEFIGEVDDRQKGEFLGKAAALLFPIAWPEPFGLVMIEAMACGTPVIAWNHGSVPEVIEHGRSGYIVNDVAGSIAAVEMIERISRRDVRRCFEARFTSRSMAHAHVGAYCKLLLRQARTEQEAGRPPAHRLAQPALGARAPVEGLPVFLPRRS